MKPAMFVVVLCFLFGHGRVWAENELRVFVSIPPQQFIADRIGGERVITTVLLPPGSSMESLQPTPKQIAALSQADLFVPIGLPIEQTWLASAALADNQVQVVNCCTGFTAPVALQHDPHKWLNPVYMMHLARVLATAFADARPAAKPDISANLQRLLAVLQLLDMDIRRRLQNIPSRTVLVSHGFLGHFAAEYGLRQIAVQEGERVPGPRHMVRLINAARSEHLRSMIVQPQQRLVVIQILLREAGLQSVAFDPLAGDYLRNMRDLVSIVVGRKIAQ